MAKNKGKTTAATEGESRADGRAPANKGYTGHHRAMIASGHVLVGDSRPRGKPYRFEEWLSPSRSYTVVKATDNGQLTRYAEQQNTDDGEELGRTA